MIKLLILVILSSCAYVHKVSVGDIDYKKNSTLKPFQVMVSETGVDIKEAADWIDRLGWHGDSRYRQIADLIAMFQMGPRTGQSVFTDKYADILFYTIIKKCPSGNVTGLLIVRETAQYPIVSGEIVRISGYCQEPNKLSKLTLGI